MRSFEFRFLLPLLVVITAAACGSEIDGSNAAGGQERDGGVGDATAQPSEGSGDASVDASSDPDGNGKSDTDGGKLDGGGDGTGGDSGGGGEVGTCASPLTPSQISTVTWAASFTVDIVTAGGKVFVTQPASGMWSRWVGPGWSQEAIPWPSNVPAGSNGKIYPGRIVQLATGKALILANPANTSTYYVTTFDGTTMTPAILLPSIPSLFPIYGFTGTSDGRYHIVHGDKITSSTAQGDWVSTPSPLPAGLSDVHIGVTTMANDRMVLAYSKSAVPDGPRHLHVLGADPNMAWSTPIDLTPTWAVEAHTPHLHGPPGGGLFIANDSPGSIWRSTDGTTFGNYESAGGPVLWIGGACFGSPLAIVGGMTQHQLVARKNDVWSVLGSKAINYVDDSRAVVLPDGRTFWALAYGNTHEYRAAP